MRSAILFPALIASIIASNTRADVVIGLPVPLTGPEAWAGERFDLGVRTAVSDLNAAGGVLDQEVRVVSVNDHCDAEQAVAAAQKLVSSDVDAVIGHLCSGAAIAASAIYADAGIPLIVGTATNPLLTERGLSNVFRICGRDDAQGAVAGNYLAAHWKDKNIAILHDGDVYGQGLAEETKRVLNAASISEVLFAQIEPGRADYADIADLVQASNADLLYFGGYNQDAGLIIGELRARGDDVQLVGGDALIDETFRLVAGEAADGTLFTSFPRARHAPESAKEFEDSENTATIFMAYAAVQAWAQAVEQAGSLDFDAVGDALRSGRFDTVLGQLGFDDKGDVTGVEPFSWYVWRDQSAVPADLTN